MKRQEYYPPVNPKLIPQARDFGLLIAGAIIASAVIAFFAKVVEMVQ